jgi:putative acetyltransferase
LGVNIVDCSEEQINAWAPADLDPTLWRNKLKTINPFVVERNGEIIGYADLQEDGYIDHFFCQHARQRQGVGSLLMEKIHEEASHRTLVRLYSDVSITAKPFFIAKGFEVVKEQLIAIRGQELSNFRMQKHLEQIAAPVSRC